MQSYTFSDISRILKVKPTRQVSDPLIGSLLTDSRKLVLPESSLFFSINNPHKKADHFISQLYEKGVRSFITDNNLDQAILDICPEGNFMQVPNVLDALQEIAFYHRHQFHYPVIGITGSNGKTIVKEWLYQLLNNDFNIVRSPRSYNSQIGVPLSIWNMNAAHNLGIFEAGISMPDEMLQLQKMIDPDIAVFTFIGEAHAEGFENIEHKIKEKLRLFINSKVLIYCADDEMMQAAVTGFKQKQNKQIQLFGWSRNEGTALLINKIDKKDEGTVIICRYKKEDIHFIIPFTDDASVHNAITCCCVLLYLGISIASIAAHIYKLRPVEMRLELKEGINNCSIINDSYSADINSLNIALDFLSQQQQNPKRTLILSDVLQSGQSSDDLYKNIAEILGQKKLNRFIGIGSEISSHATAFDKISDSSFYETTEDFIKHLPAQHFQDETILLKGARVFQFEKISHALEQKLHETVLEINLNALRNNLKQYRQLLNKDVKLMAMVKAFSYGSGSYEIASLLQHAHVDYLAVAYADEGVALRKSGIRLPIMVMNAEEAGFGNIVRFQLEPELYSFKILRSFVQYLKLHNINNYPVHLKMDTGMHRLGFVESDMGLLIEFLAEGQPIKILSVFSHLVASDDKALDDFTVNQAASFLRMTGRIEQATGYSFLKHISNTSAIHRHPEMQFDMVRLGIGLYGIDSGLKLQNVTTLKTTISQIKSVKKGESVGYNRAGMVHRDSVIATVRIGYADGYPRVLGNGNGKMLLNDQLVPVIGNVCMDMTMLDITDAEANEADEVIVFGEDLSVTSIAKWAHTIPYEILTNISQRVKRVYFEE